MPEQGLLDSVIDLAQLRGWKVHHGRPAWSEKGWRTAIQGDAGFPDLFLARKPRVILAELKSDVGKLSAFQQSWMAELDACPGVESYVWRPAHWDEIQRILW